MDEIELLCLRQTQLVQMLCEFAASNVRPDGWLSLGAAGRELMLRVPDQVASMKNRCGHSTLKALVIATDLFDLQDEVTARGSRTVYRLRPA